MKNNIYEIYTVGHFRLTLKMASLDLNSLTETKIIVQHKEPNI